MKQKLIELINDGKYEEASRTMYLMGLVEAYKNVKTDSIDKHLINARNMAMDGFVNPGVVEIITLLEELCRTN